MCANNSLALLSKKKKKKKLFNPNSNPDSEPMSKLTSSSTIFSLPKHPNNSESNVQAWAPGAREHGAEAQLRELRCIASRQRFRHSLRQMPPFVKPFVSVSTSSTPHLIAQRDRVRERLRWDPRRTAWHGHVKDVRRRVLEVAIRLVRGENHVAIWLWCVEQEGVGTTGDQPGWHRFGLRRKL